MTEYEFHYDLFHLDPNFYGNIYLVVMIWALALILMVYGVGLFLMSDLEEWFLGCGIAFMLALVWPILIPVAAGAILFLLFMALLGTIRFVVDHWPTGKKTVNMRKEN